MEKTVYITEADRVKCGKVAEAFAELYEMENVLVMDAGRYGFVMLKYYRPPDGFEDMLTFTNRRELFEELWEEWLYTKLFLLARGTPLERMGYSDIFHSLSEEEQDELLDRKNDFMKKAGLI